MDLANRVPIAVLEFCNGVVEGVMKSHRLFANVWFEAQYAASVASMSGDGHCSESGRQWSAIARRPSLLAVNCGLFLLPHRGRVPVEARDGRDRGLEA